MTTPVSRLAASLTVAALLVAACGAPAPSATPQSATASPATSVLAPSTSASAQPSPAPFSTAPSPSPPLSTGLIAIAVTSALGRTTNGPFTPATKVPALGQVVTWRFDGGPALAGQPLQVQSLTSLQPSRWTTIATVTAGADGVATYATSFDHPAFLSLRAVASSGSNGQGGSSHGLQATWRGTGGCPFVASLGAILPAPTTTSPDGTSYQVIWGWDAAGDQQLTLAAATPGGRAVPGWRHVFPACAGSVHGPLYGPDGTAYVVTSKHRATWLYSFGPAGPRAAAPYRLPGDFEGIERAPDGTVYAWTWDYTSPWDPGSNAYHWHEFYLAAIDATGRPRPGWPYTAAMPASDPTFGADGSVYLTLGYVIGWGGSATQDRLSHQIVALGPDGRMKPGWPFVLPANVGPQFPWISEGDIAVGEPPVLGPDGTLYVVAAKGVWGAGGNLVYALGPDGMALHGWPYAATLSDGSPDLATGGAAGALPPVPDSGGTVYLAMRSGLLRGTPAGHDEIVALDAAGHVLLGWPVALSTGTAVVGTRCPAIAFGGEALRQPSCWLQVGPGGVLRLTIAQATGYVGTSHALCIGPTGKAVACPAP
jgi:hypothetical protein